LRYNEANRIHLRQNGIIVTFRRLALAAFLSPFCLALLLGLSGCAGQLPGGNDTTNVAYYTSPAVLKQWVDSLAPGMSKGETFARLGRVEKDFRRLSRTEIVDTLFGGNNAGVPAGFMPPDQIRAFLESLDGYELDYKNVKKRHGFTSPIRVRTDASGYSYVIKLIFRNGLLLEKPVMTGGTVQSYSTDTLFDYLSPGLVLDRAVP
jgi:hypothetical protein